MLRSTGAAEGKHEIKEVSAGQPVYLSATSANLPALGDPDHLIFEGRVESFLTGDPIGPGVAGKRVLKEEAFVGSLRRGSVFRSQCEGIRGIGGESQA